MCLNPPHDSSELSGKVVLAARSRCIVEEFDEMLASKRQLVLLYLDMVKVQTVWRVLKVVLIGLSSAGLGIIFEREI